MGKLFYFVSGVLTGIYLDQSYKIPNLKTYVEYFSKIIKDNEKK